MVICLDLWLPHARLLKTASPPEAAWFWGSELGLSQPDVMIRACCGAPLLRFNILLPVFSFACRIFPANAGVRSCLRVPAARLIGARRYTTEDIINLRSCRQNPDLLEIIMNVGAPDPNQQVNLAPDCTAVDYCASAHSATWQACARSR